MDDDFCGDLQEQETWFDQLLRGGPTIERLVDRITLVEGTTRVRLVDVRAIDGPTRVSARMWRLESVTHEDIGGLIPEGPDAPILTIAAASRIGTFRLHMCTDVNGTIEIGDERISFIDTHRGAVRCPIETDPIDDALKHVLVANSTFAIASGASTSDPDRLVIKNGDYSLTFVAVS